MLIVKIVNDGKGTNENASYIYTVFVNDQEIARGEVGGHNRDHGWAVLLSKIADKSLVKVECGWTHTTSIIGDWVCIKCKTRNSDDKSICGFCDTPRLGG